MDYVRKFRGELGSTVRQEASGADQVGIKLLTKVMAVPAAVKLGAITR